MAPKGGKSTDRDHNLISSEGGQDTSACKISGHSLHAFSGKCPETPDLTRFTKSKWRQKEENQQTVTIIYPVLKVVKIHQHAKFQAIPSMRSLANAWKPLRTDGRTCHKTVTVGRMDQRTHVQVERGYIGLRTDGRTDGQPENIVPPAPKGGGIKMIGLYHLYQTYANVAYLLELCLFCTNPEIGANERSTRSITMTS